MYAQIPALIQHAVEQFQLGQLATAQTALLKVLQAQPRNFDALHILGVIKAMEGHREEAIELFRKALAQNKNHSFLQFNMAKALSESGRDEEALVHHRRATQLAPLHLDSWINYGVSLLTLGRHQEALDCLQKAVEVSQQSAKAWSNLGITYTRLGHGVEALDAFDRAIALQPDLAEAHYNKGVALDDLGQTQAALACLDRAIQLQPLYAAAWHNKGVVLADTNRDVEAIACYDQAMAIAPTFGDPRVCKGQLLLRRHDYAHGWQWLEARWSSQDQKVTRVPTTRPVWSGDASDRPLLLWGEQGIGDQILYASILPELAALPQKKVVALDKRLIPLFARSMPGFDFVDLSTVSDAMDFAEQLPLGSLPRLFRPDLASFQRAHHPYLQADADRSAELRRKIARGERLVCGVSWSSSRKSIGRHKSLSLEQMLTPLASPHLHFVDLQYGDTDAERQALQLAHGIEVQHLDEVDNFQDIDGLAALIQACDLVITTSNSTAHIAGALGKTTLLLLPSGKGQLWYWAEIDATIPWYPSIQSFRQHDIGDWQKPLQEIKTALETR